MKKQKLFLLILTLILGLIIVPGQSVYAYDVLETNVDFLDIYWPYQQNYWVGYYRQVDDFYVSKWYNGTCTAKNGSGMFFIQRRDNPGKGKTYCIQPNVGMYGPVTGYINYDDITKIPYSNLTNDQWENIKLIAYFGYGYGNHTSDVWYGITQCMIWEEADPTLEVKYATTARGALTGTHYIDVFRNEYNEIMSLVNNYKKNPNLVLIASNVNNDNEDELAGVEAVYEDTNNVLSSFSIEDIQNCTARIEGNKLYISATNPGKISMKFVRGDKQYKGGIVYTSRESQNVMVSTGLYSEFPFEHNVEGIKIRVSKKLTPINGNYGDAKLDGAVYGIYSDPECTDLIDTLVTDESGYTGYTDKVPYKTYYAKELEAPEGTIKDDEIHEIDPSTMVKEGEDYNVTLSLNNDIIPTRLDIIKYRDEGEPSEGSSAAGAILRLTLNSNEDEYYLATVNEDGYCSFENIPYGEYTLTEDETNSVKYLKMDEQVIQMHNSQQTYKYRVIVADNRLELFLRVQKIDKDTNEPVMLKGAKFKIWDVENKEWVTLMETPSGEMISEFETNEEGYFITPQAIKSGEYVIYESKSPDGYYLEDDYRVPEDESKLGEGGIKVTLSTQIEVEEDDSGNLIYTAQVQDRPLKGKLEIYKTGEVLTNVKNTTTDYGEKFTPVWQERGLAGVTYEIYAAEDIKSPDGRVTYVTKGTKVDTITTGEDGYAISKELYLGEYELKEVDAPDGYQTNNDIENVVLENEDELVRVQKTDREYSNERKRLGIEIIKEFGEVDYSTGVEQELNAIFGIYANEDIKNVEGNSIIPKGGLVDIVEVEGNSEVVSTADLPEGQYVVKELYTSFPYSISTKEVVVDLKYTDENVPILSYEVEYTNDPTTAASLNLIKVSTSQFGNITVVDGQIQAENFDEEQQAFLDSISAMTLDELKQYIVDNDVKVVSRAKYGIYLDEACTQPLYIRNGESGKFEKAEVETDEHGIISLENLPVGQYFVKELVAPAGYELSDEVVSVSLDISNQNATIYRLLSDETPLPELLTKLDVFTGEAVPDCVFEIRDEEGNLLLKSVTDGNGKALIPLDLFENGKTYTYTEVKAPDIYELNTEPHEFVASYEITDDNFIWTGEKIVVENVRKDSTVTFEKLDAMDSTPIPNCKFELKSLETDYVLTGVTDENGIYVFEDVPYGRYTYTELEAPEEYLIDTTPHEITISEEQTRVIVTNEKAPETGDIAVMMVTSIAVVSVIGIAFVMIKNKRKTNE